MSPRINNIVLDQDHNGVDSYVRLLLLAGLAAHQGSAISIAHVSHPFVLWALAALAPQLEARHYVFASIDDVTNTPGPGLDAGVPTSFP